MGQRAKLAGGACGAGIFLGYVADRAALSKGERRRVARGSAGLGEPAGCAHDGAVRRLLVLRGRMRGMRGKSVEPRVLDRQTEAGETGAPKGQRDVPQSG